MAKYLANISNEKKNSINTAIKILRKRQVNLTGPSPSYTILLTHNYTIFDVIFGIYHDPVLAPLKSLQCFNAINITLGLPFLRVSPDHGPNSEMIGKKKSDPQSLIKAIKFLDKSK